MPVAKDSRSEGDVAEKKYLARKRALRKNKKVLEALAKR